MPPKTKTSRGRSQTKTTSRRTEQCQVDFEEPEKIISHCKRKIKEEAIPLETIHRKKSLSRVGPRKPNCDLPSKLYPSEVEAVEDLSQATTSRVNSIHEMQRSGPNCNTQRKLRSSRGTLQKKKFETVLPGSSQDVLETNPEQKGVPQMKRKYNRRAKVCVVKTNEDEDDSNSEISNEADDKLNEVSFDIRKCETRTSRSTEGVLQKNESSSAASNSNADLRESAAITGDKQKAFVPRVKRKYNRQTKVCDSTINKNEDDFSPTVSNSNQDVSESKELAIQEPVEPRTKRKYNRRTKVPDTKTNKNKDGSLKTVSNSNMDVEEYRHFASVSMMQTDDVQCKTLQLRTASDDMQEEQKPTRRVKRKYNKRVKASDAKTDDSRVSLTSSPEDKESENVSTRTKRGAQKRLRLCSSTKDNLTGSESSLSNPDGLKKVTPHLNTPKSKRRKKGNFSTTHNENDASQSTSKIESGESEITLDFLPLITESCKKQIKRILLIAVQFQRHSRRKSLTEADVRKALAFDNNYRGDSEVDTNLESVTDSETESYEEDELAQLSCRGEWLYE